MHNRNDPYTTWDKRQETENDIIKTVRQRDRELDNYNRNTERQRVRSLWQWDRETESEIIITVRQRDREWDLYNSETERQRVRSFLTCSETETQR